MSEPVSHWNVKAVIARPGHEPEIVVVGNSKQLQELLQAWLDDGPAHNQRLTLMFTQDPVCA